jgi:glutaredoxin
VRPAGALALAAVMAVMALPAAAGCSHKATDDGTLPEGTRPLPPLSLKDDTPDLMLTWIDDKGDTHVELRPSDVPEAGRAQVRVVISDREDGTRDLFYVANLGDKRPDGTYPVATIRRREWEAEIEKRRGAYLARTAPPRPAIPGSGGPGEPPSPPSPHPSPYQGAVSVIIYGASWCGPCHQAADYLKSRGVRYVLKDIEETPGAAAEMRDKLARAGNRGGSIPVIDVGGQILIGFSTSSIDRALARAAAGGTAL